MSVTWHPDVVLGPLREAFVPALVDTEHQCASNAPDDTGKLRASVFSTLVSEYHGRVTAGAPYAMFVERGTNPHDIYPKTKKALAFTWHGKQAIFAHVHHPGTRATFFMERGALEFGGFYANAVRALMGG